MIKPCPECRRDVVARLLPASDGIGVQPWAYQVRKGPEHEPSCIHYLREKPPNA